MSRPHIYAPSLGPFGPRDKRAELVSSVSNTIKSFIPRRRSVLRWSLFSVAKKRNKRKTKTSLPRKDLVDEIRFKFDDHKRILYGAVQYAQKCVFYWWKWRLSCPSAWKRCVRSNPKRGGNACKQAILKWSLTESYNTTLEKDGGLRKKRKKYGTWNNIHK